MTRVKLVTLLVLAVGVWQERCQGTTLGTTDGTTTDAQTTGGPTTIADQPTTLGPATTLAQPTAAPVDPTTVAQTTSPPVDPTTTANQTTLAPVDPTTTAAQTTSAPVDPMTTAAQTTSAPVDQTTTAAQTTSAPVDPMTTAAQTTSAPVDPTTSAAQATSAPVDPTATVAQTSSAPVDPTTTAAQTTSAPIEPTTAADQITSAPVDTTIEDLPTPASRTDPPAPKTTLLSDPTPLPNLIDEGGVEAELGTTYAGWDKTEFRTVIATYSNKWCLEPGYCESADPLVVSANDVVVYDEGVCPTDKEFKCENDDNMVVAFYVTKPSQSHELLMTSESLTEMLMEYDDELETDLGYSVSVAEIDEVDDYPYALQPWAITLILFGIVCLIVILIIVWVWYRRKKRLENMPIDDMEDMRKNGYSGHGTAGKKDEGTLVYQAWITKAMKEGDVATQVRKGDILLEMSEVEASDTQRPDVIVARVTHQDETKPSVTTASVETTPTSPQDVQAEMPKEPPQYEETVELPPPATQAPAEAETEALNELEKLIEEGGKSPPVGLDNPTYDHSNIVDEETGTALQEGSMTTTL